MSNSLTAAKKSTSKRLFTKTNADGKVVVTPVLMSKQGEEEDAWKVRMSKLGWETGADNSKYHRKPGADSREYHFGCLEDCPRCKTQQVAPAEVATIAPPTLETRNEIDVPEDSKAAPKPAEDTSIKSCIHLKDGLCDLAKIRKVKCKINGDVTQCKKKEASYR